MDLWPEHNTFKQMISHCELNGFKDKMTFLVQIPVSDKLIMTRLRYSKGLRIMIIMVSIGIASAIVQIVVYVRHNQRVAEGKSQREAGLSPRVYVP